MNEQYTIGSLFSGYGGIELGLEWTGSFRTLWHCENEPYPSAILAERWPGIPNLGDITKVKWERVERPDLLCGGFPCQDISNAGRREGIRKGRNRSGLWHYFHEAIRILRPRIVLIENVSALAVRGLDIVLRDLASIGYDAEWLDIRASDFGAPHKRERIFIIAYPNTDCERCNNGEYHRRKRRVSFVEERSVEESESERHGRKHRFGTICEVLSDTNGERQRGRSAESDVEERNFFSRESEGREMGCETQRCCDELSDTPRWSLEDAGSKSSRRSEECEPRSEGTGRRSLEAEQWSSEPSVGRVVDGTARGLDSFIWRERIKALGNGVVPQQTRWLGEMILKHLKKGGSS